MAKEAAYRCVKWLKKLRPGRILVNIWRRAIDCPLLASDAILIFSPSDTTCKAAKLAHCLPSTQSPKCTPATPPPDSQSKSNFFHKPHPSWPHKPPVVSLKKGRSFTDRLKNLLVPSFTTQTTPCHTIFCCPTATLVSNLQHSHTPSRQSLRLSQFATYLA